MTNREFSRKVGPFTVYALEETSLKDFITEIFENEEYAFTSDNERPQIIDCGSHIGLSILYFKLKYPNATILGFEPDSNNYRALQKNLKRNHVTGVQVIKAAVSDIEGSATLYGYVSPTAISLGNSLVKSWGEREGTTAIPVKSVRLSDYIKGPIDYVKLNIEGSETVVLRDMFESKAIKQVKQMYIQYHQTNQDNSDTEFNQLARKLMQEGFALNITEKDVQPYLPRELDGWVHVAQPSMKVIRCHRKP